VLEAIGVEIEYDDTNEPWDVIDAADTVEWREVDEEEYARDEPKFTI
jgi:hypothetical protein